MLSHKILTFSFYFLFFLTPLIWTSGNHELFEYPKMMLIYLLTIIITASWLIKMIQEKKLILKRTPLDIPLLLFLGANIISTVTSMDKHISIWGYYSRSNGGLLSIISYTILYFALVSNFKASDVKKFLQAILWGGAVVALYAIPEHFGVSPSCFLLRGELSASCWVQDVQSRVFATLGQPNWLAAYLVMLIFPAIYFTLTSTKKIQTTCYLLLTTIYYLAFTFTYSRGSTLGFLAGLTVLVLGLVLSKTISFSHPWGGISKSMVKLVGIFLIISLTFGSALSSFKLIQKYSPPSRPSITVAGTALEQEGSQNPNIGTDTGTIRLIVWQGALDVFQKYPLFGTGVETFAYSYYLFRPVAHNLTTEWDFLYNKAHNEFLNYLANTGLVGFGTYMLIIVGFVTWSVKKIVYRISIIVNRKDDQRSTINDTLFTLTLLASYTSYLVQNFFSFSVVIIAVFFFLFPGLSFLQTDSVSDLSLPKKLRVFFNKLRDLFFARTFYPKLATIAIIILSFIYILTIARIYIADTLYAEGLRYNDNGRAGLAYNLLSDASQLNPHEPLYKSELGYAAAGSAAALMEEDATSAASLKEQAVEETQEALHISPNNLSMLRTAARTYYLLSTMDSSFTSKTLSVLNKSIELAPTDPKLIYNKALILLAEKKDQEAVIELLKSLELKPNYKEASITLAETYFKLNQKKEALEQINKLLKIYPQDPEALSKLAEWGK